MHAINYTCDVCKAVMDEPGAHARWRRVSVDVQRLGPVTGSRQSSVEVCSARCAATHAERQMQVDVEYPAAPAETPKNGAILPTPDGLTPEHS
jgi:hypothetical protein